MKRRDFLKLAGSAAVISHLPAGCGNDVSPPREIPGAVDDDPVSSTYGQIPIRFADFRDLDEVGGAVTVKLTPPTDGRARPFRVPAGILLIHRGAPADPPEWAAMESTCTHASCPLGYSARDGLVECPCHASRFRAAADPNLPGSCAGDVVHLPAKQGPTVFEAESDGQDVWIRLSVVLGCKTLPAISGGKLTVLIADQPQLANPGGSVVGTPGGFSDPIALVRTDASTVVAVNARCTHLGCTVGFQNGRLQCPCHESAFGLDGRVLGPPAIKNLQTYPVMFDGTTIVVTLV